MHVVDGDLVEVAALPFSAPVCALVADGARAIAVGIDNGEVGVHVFEGAAVRIGVAAGAARPTALAFSRDGRFLATGAEDGAVTILDAETGKRVA